MENNDWLVDHFEAHRARLKAVAYRMLGTNSEADDAVQETWIRLSRTDAAAVENLAGWLTTVVGRVCLDLLRSRASRRQEPPDAHPADLVTDIDTEHEALLTDSVGSALLVVLDRLSPSERLAFVLHDVFAVPFDEIGVVLSRSANAAKQLASRARHKVQGTQPSPDADPVRQRRVVDAFLAASRNGDFDALVAMLDPDVVLQADTIAVRMGSPEAVHGAAGVAGMFAGRALAAQPALVDGAVGVVWMVDGRPKVVWDFTMDNGMISFVDMLAAPDRLDELDLVVLGD